MQVQIIPRTPCAHCKHEAGSLLLQVILYFLGQESLLPKLQDKVVIFFDPGTSPASTTSATDRPHFFQILDLEIFNILKFSKMFPALNFQFLVCPSLLQSHTKIISEASGLTTFFFWTFLKTRPNLSSVQFFEKLCQLQQDPHFSKMRALINALFSNLGPVCYNILKKVNSEARGLTKLFFWLFKKTGPKKGLAEFFKKSKTKKMQ